MSKYNIQATMQTCKALIDQINEYASGEKMDLRGNNKVTEVKDKNEIKISDIPQELINSLNQNFLLVIDFINSYLLSNNNAALYSSVLLCMKFDINYNQRGFTDIIFKDPVIMSFNPLFIGDRTISEVLTTVLNELMKFMFAHPEEYAKLNAGRNDQIHQRLEKSSDVHSSELILRDIKVSNMSNSDFANILKIPKDVYTLNKLENDIRTDRNSSDYYDRSRNQSLKTGETFEYYFNATGLIPTQKAPSMGGGSGKSNQKNQNGDGQGQNSNDSTNQNQGQSSSGSKNSLATPNNNSGSSVHNWEGEDPDNIRDKIQSTVSNALSTMSEKQKGDIPEAFKELLKKLFEKPKLNWKQILRKYIGFVPDDYEPTKMRLNRRNPERTDLSGTITSTTLKIVVAIDTSGSMSSKELEECFNEIFNIISIRRFDLTIIECDAEIGRVYKAKSIKDVKLEVTGRGGTSYIPVIEYLNKNKYYRDAIMIYFTDGYGDYEIPRPRTFRNLWVITGDDARESNLSLNKPYGEVRTMRPTR